MLSLSRPTPNSQSVYIQVGVRPLFHSQLCVNTAHAQSEQPARFLPLRKVGAALNFDLLEHDEASRVSVLRVSKEGLVKLWSSLTLLGFTRTNAVLSESCRSLQSLWTVESSDSGCGSGPGLDPVFSLSRTFSEQDLVQFSVLTGDSNPLHLDQDFAKTTTFSRPLVHGVLVNGLISALLGSNSPGCVLLKQEIRFPAPLFVDEPVLAQVQVQRIRLSTALVSVRVQTQVQTQKDPKVVLEGTVTMPSAGMSSFLETPSPGRQQQLLDDTIPLTATIEASQNLQSHTEYIIRVQRGVSSENSWQVCGISLPLPPKKLIGNMDREFMPSRNSEAAEIALQQVSMFFRSDPKWEVQEPLRDMGWRIRKKYFMVKNKEQPKERYLLSWVDLGPDKFLSDKDLQSAIKLLSSLSSSLVVPLVFSSVSESSALLIRPFSERGSLRDHICKVKPKEMYLKKYCNPKKSQGLDLSCIKLYGRSILETLRLLHDSGLV
ncbi:hypothetical protein WMY93_031618 [Mugilogobius chulae]|uniref:MaoC-like domain-containing protein n=1 Tax=Mugilogobius chulae TaxID=88201 RepID=A0AAW0MLQ2_9GOBI